jgi:hypothetical protein
MVCVLVLWLSVSNAVAVITSFHVLFSYAGVASRYRLYVHESQLRFILLIAIITAKDMVTS